MGAAGPGRTSVGTGTDTSRSRVRKPLAVAALAVVPWTVVTYPGGADLVFAWGLVTADPLHVVDLWSYLFVYTGGPASLPSRLQAWPVATVLFALAVASAALSAVGREDTRVTAGLLALAALVHLRVTLGLARVGELAVPVGPVVLFGAAWWAYGS